MTARRWRHRLFALALSIPPVAWPQQPPRLPTVAVLSDGGPVPCASGLAGYPVACMVDALRALGDVEGRNVALTYRFAHGDHRQLPALAAELVALRPDVLYTLTSAGADAAAAATSTIPIVVGPAGVTILQKLAGNLARPAGNVTGQTLGTPGQDQKCLQLLKELAPRVSRVAVIVNPDGPLQANAVTNLGVAASQLGLTLIRVGARNAAELPQAFAAAAASGAQAIYMFDEGPLAGNVEVRRQVADWALGRRLPLASSNARFAADGALVSQGADIPAIARRAAFYVHRILGGARPADLPVESPTIFKLSVNRKTAAALGLTIPTRLLMRADEVIE